MTDLEQDARPELERPRATMRLGPVRRALLALAFGSFGLATGEFVMLGLRIITQFPAFTREVRVFSVRL